MKHQLLLTQIKLNIFRARQICYIIAVNYICNPKQTVALVPGSVIESLQSYLYKFAKRNVGHLIVFNWREEGEGNT